MGKFSISAKLKARANKDNTYPVEVTYTYERVRKEYMTNIAVDKESWDSVKKLVAGNTKEATNANVKIQRIQALIFEVASALAEPTHELVKAGYKLAAAKHVDDDWVAETQAVMKRIEDNEGGLDDVFGTITNINEVLQYQRDSFRDLMNEGKASQTKAAKSKIIKRLEDKGIYKSDDKRKEELAYFIKMQENYILEIDGLLKPGTIKQRKALFTNLARFSAATNYPLTFEAIDLKFYKAYWEWVSVTKGNGDNYFGSLIKRLKIWLGWCIDNNVKVNPKFRSTQFKTLTETIDVVYLKTEELEWLDDFRNHANCKPTWVRLIDMALFQCSIGCRYSDMVNASWHFDGDMLKGHTLKNESTYTIPLKSSKWLQIIKKPEYNTIKGQPMSFALPVRHIDKVAVLSEQKYNKYIKECLKAMYHSRGLHMDETEMLVKKETNHGVVSFPRFFKYELIGTHSMRRSFVSRMVRLGYKQETVAAMIGTRDMRELRKYFQIEEQDIRDEANRVHGATA